MILIACDSFKGSLSSIEIANLFKNNLPHPVETIAVADGGEGSLDALAFQGDYHKAKIDSLGVEYIAKDTHAYIEVANIVGITQSDMLNLDVNMRSSAKVGEVLVALEKLGFDKVTVFLGGSATNDGGFGLLKALGYRFLDEKGQSIDPIPAHFAQIVAVEKPQQSILSTLTVHIATDVINRLCGKHGATHTFGKQKGVCLDDMPYIDNEILRIALMINPLATVHQGSGSAGGIGFALLNFEHHRLCSGFQLIADKTHLIERIREADIVITGEGKLDYQSRYGKAPYQIAQLAKHYDKPTIAVCGISSLTPQRAQAMGFDQVFVLKKNEVSISQAIREAEKHLVDVIHNEIAPAIKA